MAISNVSTSSSAQGTTDEPGKSFFSALAVLTTLFFMWGLITSLNDILVPHLKPIFDLDYTRIMLIQFAFFSAYFFFSVPSGKVIELIGYKKTMVVGLLTAALGALLFIPAAAAPSYPLFLAALIILATGITALQVSANPYVAILGPPRTASSRLVLTQAFNSLGTVIGPYFGSLVILSAAPKSMDELHAMAPDALQAYRIHEASSVKGPYLGLALVLALLAIAIGMFKLPRIAHTEHAEAGEHLDSIWHYRHLVLGALGIFVYVGAEVSIGSFLVNYFNQPEIGGLAARTAAKMVAFYWGGAMVGRFIGSALLQKIRGGVLLGIFGVCACLLVLISMATTGQAAMVSILLVGLFNSIMFPTIFTLAIAHLGPLTSKGSGLLNTAIVGGAILPVIEGAMADRMGIHHAFILPAVCYLYIVYYAFSGSKVRKAVV